jgi:hypothetical protein
MLTAQPPVLVWQFISHEAVDLTVVDKRETRNKRKSDFP